MKKKRLLILSIIALLFALGVYAQSGFNAGGGDAVDSQMSVSYSIGQIFYEPVASYGGSLKVTPGVQQTYLISVVSTNEIKANLTDIKLYPNPTTDYLELSLDSKESLSNLQAILYDLSGRQIGVYPVSTSITRIQTDILLSGTYLLKLTYSNSEIKTFKVIKK